MKPADAVHMKLMDNGREGGENGPPPPAAAGDDYDPHDHRETENPTTNMETLVHLLKCSLGTGILAMPQAFARTGLVMGIVGTVLLGVLLTYCLHVLVGSTYALCKRARVPLLEYPAAMGAGLREGPRALRPLAKFAPPMVDVFIVVYQLGIGCVYIVFMADNIKAIVDPFYVMSSKMYMLIILAPLMGFNLVRSLKLLAPFSSLANILTLVGLAMVAYCLLAQEPVKEELDMWGNLADYPLFVGTTLFALTAVGVVVALENNMATPKAFGKPFGVLNLGMAFIVVVYVVIGLMGYLMCRSKCHDSITLDIHINQWVPVTVRVLFIVAIFISYGLQCYVPVDIVWRCYVRPRLQRRGVRRLLLAEYILRIVLCLLTFVLAVTVPLLGLFISLFGALCLSVLGIVFPGVLQACVVSMQGRGWGFARWRLVRAVLLVLLGLSALIIGTYTTLQAIVLTIMQASHEVKASPAAPAVVAPPEVNS